MALLTDVTLIFALVALAVIKQQDTWLTVAVSFGGFGLLFAPIWGAVFGWLYLKLRRAIYAPRPVHPA